jgi:hypothetical protein
MSHKSINLQDILIQNIPEKPTRIWDHSPQKVFHDYRVRGYVFDNGKAEEIGHITLSLCQYSTKKDDNDDFWFERKRKVLVPRVVAVFQGTEPNYRGQGVNAELLRLINELVKARFGKPISSDIGFCENPLGKKYACVKGFTERPAMRVWEKLEARRLAYSRPYKGKPRWIMY